MKAWKRPNTVTHYQRLRGLATNITPVPVGLPPSRGSPRSKFVMYGVTLDVSKTLKIRIVFQVMTLDSLVPNYQRFGETKCLNVPSCKAIFF
jgi:hypothetical protein